MSKTSTTAEAYSIICDMEHPLLAVKSFARLIARFAEVLDEDDGLALQAAAWHITDLVKALEERRGKAFRLLHPNHEELAAVPTVAFVRPSGDK
jgi:hypothetical protein